MRHGHPYELGDVVKIKDSRIDTYRLIHAVTRSDVFTVAHVEKREGRRCLYLQRPGWDVWVPVWAPHVQRVKRKS